MWHRDEGIPKHKGCSPFHEGDPEEEDDEEEESMGAMCYSAKTYSSIQVTEKMMNTIRS